MAVFFMRTGKASILQPVCYIAMLVPSTSRTLRYVHATQKYWICIIRWQAQSDSFSLFLFYIFLFCVCVWPILFQPMFFFLERSTKIDLDARRFDVWVGKAYNVVPAKKKCLQCLSGWLIMSTAWHRYPAFSFAN